MINFGFYFILSIPEIKKEKNLFSFLKHVNPKNQDQFTIFIWLENLCL